MVGSMLSRVLSRTKIFSSNTEATLLENNGHHACDPSHMVSVHPNSQLNRDTQNIKMNDKVPTISFQQDVKRNSVDYRRFSQSSRKHSYSSITEDSEIPQSFTTRPLDEVEAPHDTTVDCSRPVNGLRGFNDVDGSADIDEGYTLDIPIVVKDSNESLYSTSTQAARSPACLETMPDEILDLIFSLVTLNPETDRYVSPKVDVFSLLFVSKAVHAAALRVLYRHVKIPQSKAFFKVHNSLAEDAHLGKLVQCLDFSHYSSIGFGRARSTSNETPYLTPKTLQGCLDRTPNLKAFLVHEHVDDELDVAVLSKLFWMSSLRALDLCACSSQPFTKAFTDVCATLPLWNNAMSSIERLSLHECTTIRSQVFENLMPKLHRLTHLDVAHTMINDKALMSIPETARITHLNLERCTQIIGSAVVKFLSSHSAVKDTVVYLNLQADASRYRLLDEDDIGNLLSVLPDTLRSLNIGGARINRTHACHLRTLATHLEELGLKGADLGLGCEIRHILSLDNQDNDETRHSLRYLDLTDVKSVTQLSLTYSPTTIIGPESMPLEVIELSESVRKDIEKRSKNIKDPEWTLRELGRRGWYVRQPAHYPEGSVVDDGSRNWKMGAKWWGMRKIPMFDQNTGGMYGYFMFKRA